jgi:hypothetical protein
MLDLPVMLRFAVFLLVMFLFACGGKPRRTVAPPRDTPTERPTRPVQPDVTVTSSDGEDLSWLVPV